MTGVGDLEMHWVNGDEKGGGEMEKGAGDRAGDGDRR